MKSDVVLDKHKRIKGMPVPATMFIAVPIMIDGKVKAILTERFNPAEQFSSMLALGYIGLTGETYAFNSEAKLISKSRFTSQPEELNLLASDEDSILSIDLTSPYQAVAKEKDINVNRSDKLTYMASQALSGVNGFSLDGYLDYRGIAVWGAWLWDKDLGIGIATEIDQEEALNLIALNRFILLFVMAVMFVLMAGLVYIIMLFARRSTDYLILTKEKLEETVRQRTINLE